MTHTFREFILGGVLVAPIAYYAVAAVILFVMLRPVLHLMGFSKYFSNPSIAELSLYIAIFGMLTLYY
jgi:hypothetical protein